SAISEIARLAFGHPRPSRSSNPRLLCRPEGAGRRLHTIVQWSHLAASGMIQSLDAPHTYFRARHMTPPPVSRPLVSEETRLTSTKNDLPAATRAEVVALLNQRL